MDIHLAVAFLQAFAQWGKRFVQEKIRAILRRAILRGCHFVSIVLWAFGAPLCVFEHVSGRSDTFGHHEAWVLWLCPPPAVLPHALHFICLPCFDPYVLPTCLPSADQRHFLHGGSVLRVLWRGVRQEPGGLPHWAGRPGRAAHGGT